MNRHQPLEYAVNDVWDRLYEILLNSIGDETVYVYRLDEHGVPVTPFLLKCSAEPDLPSVLKQQFGGGAFRLLIRRGKVLIFSGGICIADPPPTVSPSQLNLPWTALAHIRVPSP